MKAIFRYLLPRLAWTLILLALLSLLAHWSDRLAIKANGKTQLRAVLFINGTLGDRSFFDSAARGMRRAGHELPVSVRVVEGGNDPTRWESGLSDLADSGDYDIVLAGTYTMVPYVQRLAAEFPRTRFVMFDATVDYAHCACGNVHSILFRQNEGAYLAGYLAAMLLQAHLLPGVPPNAGLGLVGGMQLPVIDDYLLGFGAGARAANPSVRMAVQYANGFSDPAAGKDIANAQIAAGAGVIFQAAGATGQGVTEAASEAHRYTVGVDLDQYEMYRHSNPQRAAAIITSVLKNVDVAIVQALTLALRQQLPYGRADSLGLAEGGIGMAPHSEVLDRLPVPLRQRLDAVRADLVSGRVRLPSGFASASAEARG
ncbi:ABC transporter periplasmic/surface lipoprotein [Herbaspirillum rubrisubalbicans M1]|uniref:BMP family lipoprotein n=1 Tax=Herbaspirillum rubrisubalbicans TaxID=80842 RepID=UPI00073A0B1A|nr:BMP family ABC transporter substrate-binding protein [Herbaspirillum rubrisubalbicans]ALU89593.1 ABC transporter periplasmic/surface lipoprotein [Herbaspirillum rubrisubalbicans M1]